jgi:hypothetical protein
MLRLSLIVLASLALVGGNAQAADPLDCMPKSAQLVVVVDRPRTLAEAITKLEAFKQAQTLPQVRQLYDSPTVQRLLRLLAFAEKELGAKWPELLDQVAGNGIALGLQFTKDPAPPIAVVSGTDAKQVERAFDLGLKVLEEEAARLGNKDALKVERADGVTFAHFGDFHFARSGTALIASNDLSYLKESLALVRSGPAAEGSRRKARADAATVLPKGPLAWVWFDFASVKETQTAKDFYDSTRKDVIQTVFAGSTIDCLRRSDFIAAGLYQEAGGFRLRFRLPAGREGLWSDLAVHVPPKGKPGSLPLLEPPGTIYSQSLHLDIGYVWKNRDRMITGDSLKQFEKGEKEASKILPTNVKLGELLEMWGPYHRIVVANHDQRPYKTEPSLKLPAFGYVATTRDKQFGENLEAIVRAVAIIGSLQFGTKSREVEHEGVKLIGYRFPENKPLADDPQGIRFNFEPCFAVVGDEVVLASTLELGKKLITELKKPQQATSTAVWQAKAFAATGASTLTDISDPLITDAVLGRGIGLTEARQEIADLVKWVHNLGTGRIEIDITGKEYRLDVVWTPGK